MKQIKLDISGLHAEAIATYFIIVLKNYFADKVADEIPEEKLILLGRLDHAYQKLNALTAAADDETPQAVFFSIPEAEAFIKVFTEEEFKAAALQDDFYQRHSYAAWFGQIFKQYLEAISSRYVEALAA